MSIPKEMKALYYKGPKDFDIRTVPTPEPGENELLLKVTLCGVCGTDGHIHDGEFMAKFPLIPGHEAVGKVVGMGKNVKGFEIGDRCAADVGTVCGNCFYCKRNQSLYCESFAAKGVAMDGGFAQYITYDQSKVTKFYNLTDEDATLLEPASCAIHGLERISPIRVGAEALVIGAGPTGLIFAQLLRLNGCRKVTIAANAGIKMDLAKKLECGDEYIELKRGGGDETKAQWQKLKDDHPYGFDIVVEASGVQSLLQDSINYVRRGGKLLIYGVYEDAARVTWSPMKIFGDEITILGSFSQTYCFPTAVAYLDSGRIRTQGMITHTYDLDQYQQALDTMNDRKALKIAIRPPQ